MPFRGMPSSRDALSKDALTRVTLVRIELYGARTNKMARRHISRREQGARRPRFTHLTLPLFFESVHAKELIRPRVKGRY